ncbi:MAG: Hsp70 family protein [bacterium]
MQASISPDEAVALGAAIHADQLVNRKRDAVLIDVTPLSLRVGTVGGFSEVVIPKNTFIPIEHSKTFVTALPGQPAVKVRIRIYQGDGRRRCATRCWASSSSRARAAGRGGGGGRSTSTPTAS